MRHRGSPLFLVLLAWPAIADDRTPHLRVPPKEPTEALKTFRTLYGFRMDLLAHEPQVTSPVAMVYDENGRAFVLEMRDYPYTDKANDRPFTENTADKPLGRVRLLQDLDGDGVFDRSTIFADNLSWPTGLALWKEGLFVAATPDIWYLKDTNQDGKADIREKVYTGFRKFNIQAVINNLGWGLDHHIYGAGGTNGGRIVSPTAEKPSAVVLSANDFRFDPVSRQFEALSGGARFGQSFDDWGNRFLCNIRNPAIHVVLPAHYLARNPHLPVTRAWHDAAESGDTLPVYRISPSEPWRVVRAQRWALEGQIMPRSELVADGYFTSSSGITLYRGSAYPPAFRGNVFLGEVANNLIHRQALTADGVTFKAQRTEAKEEFLASTDIWFRPVNFVNAPDGTLHILDMYRETIEHPWSIPDDIKARLDLESGRDRGRIYRLSPPGFRSIKIPKLGQASTADLVQTLTSPDAWWRETAHRLLFERQDRVAVAPLRAMLHQHPTPLARLHALWSLHGLGSLQDTDVLQALKDSAPGMREQGLLLSESRLRAKPEWATSILPMVEDPDPRVCFQLAFSLGESQHSGVPEALERLAVRHGSDVWIRTAILSSASDRASEVLTILTRKAAIRGTRVPETVFKSLAQIVGSRRVAKDLQATLKTLTQNIPDKESRLWQTAILCGLGIGLKSTGQPLTRHLQESPEAASLFQALLGEAQAWILDPKVSGEQREQSLQLLSFADFQDVKKSLKEALGPRQPPGVQMGAIRVLSSFVHPDIAPLLLEAYPGYSPTVRAEAIEALLSRADRLPPLLSALEGKRVSQNDVPGTRKSVLMRHANPAIRDRALALFRADVPGPRREVIARFQKALELPGDQTRGMAIFRQECAPCHRLGKEGRDVGPNLESVRHQPAAQVLQNILDPNREVSPTYLEYYVETHDGRVSAGRILSETATSLTLQRANDMQDTILRRDIESLSGGNRSLMPEGLELKISLQQMADLLSVLTRK